MYRTFSTAKNAISINYPNIDIIYEYKYIREVKTWPEDTFIKWLTEADGCILLCHPFEGDYPPDWDYSSFFKKLKEAVMRKNIRIFPDPDHLEDPTFSQVSCNSISDNK